MTPELVKILCLVLASFGVALCFLGYRIFRVCLAAAGLLLGLWAGSLLATELGLVDLARTLIVAGIALLGAVLSAAIYHVGVFVMGGAALGGAVLFVGTHLGRPIGLPLLGGAMAAGGILAVAAHRRLVIYATALVGGLLVLAGLAPMVSGAAPPESYDAAWLRAQVESLPSGWLLGGLGMVLAGVVFQLWSYRRSHGLGFSFSASQVSLPEEPDRPRRSRARKGVESRTHGAICPRCGGIVDVDALLCHSCGNDRWD
ncbi:MAG: hypothetical protein RBU30_06375 [Polyangia bacterium]|jgi:hypothetical protein|nr:hypothetical protein [Polyangia bacterium]